MERVLYGIGMAVGQLIYFIFVGIFRLVGYGIFRYKQANPETIGLSEDLRFEHTLITSGSGWGKTQLLQKLILDDLPEVRRGVRSVVVIDSQGDMIRKILRLRELAPPRAPPPPEVSAVPAQNTAQQRAVEKTEDTPAKSSVLRHLWHIVLVFLMQCVLISIGVFVDFIGQKNHWSGQNRDTAGSVAVVVVGLALCGWLGSRRNRPAAVAVIIGAALFSAAIVSVTPEKQAALYACLVFSGTVIFGFLGVRPLIALIKRLGEEPIPVRKVPYIPQQASLADRLILIDPSDIDHPPALNLFDFGLDRAEKYSALERESLVNGAIAMYEFMFGALLGAEMTNRQGVIFRYLARLLMVVPNATIYTLMDFLEHPELARPYLPKLDMATQRFLTTQFFAGGFDTTREQILSRLWGVLSNPTLARMFSHSKNKLNLFEAMNRGSLILINTNKELLKQEGCELFGRFMIALLSQATQERAAIPERDRTACFVYIDEAHDYFDETLELLLNTARKYNVGLTLAHQNLAQFHRKLEQTVLASTSMKWAGGNSADDAYQLAKEMNCEVDFIRQLKKDPLHAHFAFYARNTTPNAVEMIVPLGLMERQPKMSDMEQKALLAKNRERVGAPYDKKLLQQSEAVVQAGVNFDLEEQRAL